jgi:LmbE family N-acetylglucosaminyl deacetylase
MWCLPQSLLGQFTGDPALGTPDEAITTAVDVRGHIDVRWQAMRAHASQTPPYDAMTPDLRDAFLATDHLIRVDPPWTGADREHDWRPWQ